LAASTFPDGVLVRVGGGLDRSIGRPIRSSPPYMLVHASGARRSVFRSLMFMPRPCAHPVNRREITRDLLQPNRP